MAASLAYGRRFDTLQEVPGVMDLVVGSFLRLLGGASQSFGDILFAYFFKISVAGESTLPKTLTVIALECFAVRYDPCFHCLNHEVDPPAFDPLKVPSVTTRQMIDGFRVDRRFRIDEKNDDSRLCPSTLVMETLVRLVARPARDQPPVPPALTEGILDFDEKTLHTLA